jgi:hypothetical protein
MKFVDIEELDISIELDVLKRDSQRYSMFLYQHNGEFSANNRSIGNAYQALAKTKFQNLLKKAKQDNIALVMSPEYSCPKSIIDNIIENESVQPIEGKIWVLGGESINKEEIKQLISANKNNVLIHCEDVFTTSDKEYLNPLYYIFKGKHNKSTKLIILIQFKTKHMGGLWSGGSVEADNLIEGENVYVLKNSNNSTRLVSFICSEAMNVKHELSQDIKNKLYWYDMPFLVLNPQINPDPSNLTFINFRNFILNDDKKEIISLNWGKETTIKNEPWFKKDVNTPRSGIFFKTLDIELDHSPKRIVANHKKGFYFLHQNRNKFVYLLNGNIELIKIENKSVDINEGVQQQKRRDGPQAMMICMFDEETSDFIEQRSIDDCHIDFFDQRGIENEFLLNPNNSIVDKERLVNISTGKIIGKHGENWCDVIYLNSFKLKETDECNCRMTYVEDSYATSEHMRIHNCTNVIELDQIILPNNSIYPDSIKDLTYQNIVLSYSSDSSTYHYKYNLTDENGEIKKATICYLGNASNRDVESTYDELQKLFEEGTNGKSRIVVFYKRGIKVFSKYDLNAGSILNQSIDNSSIL